MTATLADATALRHGARAAVLRLQAVYDWHEADATVVLVALLDDATADEIALGLAVAARCRDDIRGPFRAAIELDIAAGLLGTLDRLSETWADVCDAVDERDDLLAGGLAALDRWADLPVGADRHGCWVGRIDALDHLISRYASGARP